MLFRSCEASAGRPLSVGTSREAGPGWVCAGTLLSCRSHYRAGICGDCSVFPAAEGEAERSRWSPRQTVEESRGQPMKTQLPRPLQLAWQAVVKAFWVVLVAAMALATQLALVTP